MTRPSRYWLSTLEADTPLSKLVRVAHLRWRIERDYPDLKQDLGLGHDEGHGWRGFHHHASLSIAADGFLVGQRLRREALAGQEGPRKRPHELPGTCASCGLLPSRPASARSATWRTRSRRYVIDAVSA